MDQELIEKQFRKEVLSHPELYPNLYDDEIKKNRYKINGTL